MTDSNTPADAIVPTDGGHKSSKRTDNNWELRIRRLELVVSILASGAVVIALYYNMKAVESNFTAVRSSVTQNVTGMSIRVDELFLERPELYECFNEGKEPANRNDPKLKAAATMVLDVLDVAVTQTTTYRDMWDSPEGWDNWVHDQFKKSPFLCDFLEAHKNWYGSTLYAAMKRAKAHRDAEKPQIAQRISSTTGHEAR